MKDDETRKSIHFLRPSLCFFRRSVEMCVGEGKRWTARKHRPGDEFRKSKTRDIRNLRAGQRSRATVTKFIGKSTCPADGTCHFLDEDIQARGYCFLCLESPHDHQRTHSFHLVSLQLSCICTKIGDASLRCSSFLPCRLSKPFSPKAADRLPFPLTKSQKRPHARTQRSSSRTSNFSVSDLFRSVFLQDKLKDRRSFLLAARYFLRPRLARSSIIALPRCVSAALHCTLHAQPIAYA